MATLLLGALGQSVLGPLGGMIGALAGRFVDQALFGEDQNVEGPRLSDLNFQASTEGATIPRVWGKMRVSPQVIWATQFNEITTTTETGGKGSASVNTTEFSYTVSFASGLCEGAITGIGRAWADGKLLDLGEFTHRIYFGNETQGVDPKIVAIEGEDNAPAFRGLAYIVFEDMALEKFGNRVPQMTFEVFRRPQTGNPALEDMARAVTIIPGTTEFGYATTQVSVDSGFGETTPDNSHARADATDMTVALDELQAQVPNVTSVTLVVAWHGTDLRAGNCEIRPKVEDPARTTQPFQWQVGPVSRQNALVVTQFEGKPAAGGAPSDRSVYEAIKELKNRGFKVTLYPFILMDIAAGNGLPDPHGGAEQAPYPWRGRITCHPAPGQPGSPDKTATAASQIAAFVGTAAAGHFAWNTGSQTVSYTGPNEWSLRRQVLHLATIGVAAGGVDQFCISSELIGITTVRSAASIYPAANHLISLAGEIRSIVGSSTRIGYAADWSEYHSHRPIDGSNDVHFHLDPLWADSNVDFIGIDNYLPLSDWRDGTAHLDAQAGYKSLYDAAYLEDNIEGGEYYDWYYANQSDRDNQIRTPIDDNTPANEHWVFRNKDIRNWWLNAHHNRPAGIRSGSATGWVAQSKPIVFTELGCPAVDKGSNQPNVFVDPKSSESFYPHYSNRSRDDAIQKMAIEANLNYWNPSSGNNPISSVYHSSMIDFNRIALWTWDARPYPEFPNFEDIWVDSPNWRLGHWLTGRLNLVRLADLVGEISHGFGVGIDTSPLLGLVVGYLSAQIMTARDEIAPLAKAYFFDAVESEGKISFRHRGTSLPTLVNKDDLIKSSENGRETAFKLTRGQESELPRGLNIKYYAQEAGYRQVSARSRRLIGDFQTITETSLPIAFADGHCDAIADALLVEAHVARERASFTLPPSALALEPGDAIQLNIGERIFRLRLGEIGLGAGREAMAVREDPNAYNQDGGVHVPRAGRRVIAPGPAVVYFLDLPVLTPSDEETAHAPRVVAYGAPWAPVAVYRAASLNSAFSLDTIIETAAVLGVTTETFYSGPLWRFDRGNTLTVQIGSTSRLVSAFEIDVLNGLNLVAVRTATGRWELLQFMDAELVGKNTFALTNLLRGQFGTDTDMADSIADGAPFALLDENILATSLPVDLARSMQLWRYGPRRQLPSNPLFQLEFRIFSSIGLRPYAPAHFTGVRDGAGNVTLNWVRRTRVGGDDWEQQDVPLSETSEAYEVDILNGGNVVRTLAIGTPSVSYSAASQTADFGSPPATFDAIAYQLSATTGRGAGTRSII